MVAQATIQASSKRVLVATGTKLNQRSNFWFGDAADLSHLITTPDADTGVLAAFEAAGVHLTLISA